MRAIGLWALLLGALLAASASHAQSGRASGASPFSALAGTWSGNGAITYSGGQKEAIRCRANYSVQEGGTLLLQDLRCASASYKLEVRTNIRYEAGAIRGTWSEATNRVSGTISGRAGAGRIEARVTAPSFSARMTVLTRGGRQEVVLRPQRVEVSQVSVHLRRYLGAGRGS